MRVRVPLPTRRFLCTVQFLIYTIAAAPNWRDSPHPPLDAPQTPTPPPPLQRQHACALTTRVLPVPLDAPARGHLLSLGATTAPCQLVDAGAGSCSGTSLAAEGTR